MTTKELQAILTRMGWEATTLATYSSRDPRNMRRMVKGQIPVDDVMAAWILEMEKLWAAWIAEMERAWAPVQALLDRPPRRARPDVGREEEVEVEG